MDPIDRLAAIEGIRRAKARYFRGVDTGDGELVRSVLAENCELNYRGCCTDPATGTDFLPAMNVVLKGRESWLADGLSRAGIVSVHQGHDADIEVTGETSANGVWSFTDRLFVKSGTPFSVLTGYGHYHESYELSGGIWRIRTLHITRIRVEIA